MAVTPEEGIYGRVRQEIALTAGASCVSSDWLQIRKTLQKDRFVRGLLQSGRLGEAYLDAAVTSHIEVPSRFVWLAEIEASIINRAEKVFRVQSSRGAEHDVDFELNGAFHRICRSLQYDWHYYDAILEQLLCDDTERPDAVPATVQRRFRYVERQFGSIWGFALVVVAGLVTGPLLAREALKYHSERMDAVCLLLVAAWALPLLGFTLLTLPRHGEQRETIFLCSRCGREFESHALPEVCPDCEAPLKT
jgi:hypothetical protein